MNQIGVFNVRPGVSLLFTTFLQTFYTHITSKKERRSYTLRELIQALSPLFVKASLPWYAGDGSNTRGALLRRTRDMNLKAQEPSRMIPEFFTHLLDTCSMWWY